MRRRFSQNGRELPWSGPPSHPGSQVPMEARIEGTHGHPTNCPGQGVCRGRSGVSRTEQAIQTDMWQHVRGKGAMCGLVATSNVKFRISFLKLEILSKSHVYHEFPAIKCLDEQSCKGSHCICDLSTRDEFWCI